MKSSMNERRFFIGGTFGNPMSWRFIPDDDDTAKQVVKDGDEDFDKDRQKRDQDAANQRKYQDAQAEANRAKQQAQEAQEQANRLAQEKAELEQKLADAQAKAADQGIQIPELKVEDYRDSDVPIVQTINALKKALDAKDQRIKNLEKTKDDLLNERKADAETTARNKVYDELLDSLDDDYGPQYRNAAVAAFDKLIKDGKVPKGDPARATRMMEKCYKDAAAAAKKETDDSVDLDSSTGGNAPGGMSKLKLKPGSLEEVEEQVAAAIKSS